MKNWALFRPIIIHIKEKITQANQGIGVIKTYFMRPHLDYADIVYDQSTNDSFSKKLERIQYNAA